MEVRRMKERQKLARQQERYHRQLQLRMERELRSRQITEVSLVESAFAATEFNTELDGFYVVKVSFAML